MAELTMEFREDSTQGRCWLQEAGLLVVTQRSLQRLVSPLHLPVGLGVVPRGQTGRGPNPTTKGLPHLGRELGSKVGDNVLAGGQWEALLQVQTSHPATNSRTSASRVGHQKRRRMNWLVLEVPVWQASRLEWPNWKTRLRTDSGTKRRLQGPPAGLTWPRWATWTADSRPQVTTPMTRARGRMD